MEKFIEEYFYVSDNRIQWTGTRESDQLTVWRGIQKAMKITTAIILIAALHVSASGIAQKISFAGENVPLAKVFNAIEDQLGFGVLMPHKLMESSKPVTVKIEGGTLDELLQKCFEFQPWKLSYAITGHTIYISEAKPSPDQSKDFPAPGKNVNVTGSVLNESGEPLSGANVTIKETEKGTITNAKGEFKLSAVPINNTLIISFIGYIPQEIKVNGITNVTVYLKITKNELDKVVVQAYGLTTQRLATGNIATVTSEQIEKQPVMNPLAALEGQVAGVIVTQSNGYASSTFKIEIRGRSVINPDLPSEPLYIVDGVPLTTLNLGNDGNYQSGSYGVTQNGFLGPASGQSPFFSINPADIESITVLKDADATSIYGSRGANGVIIITTKKGKVGKTKLDVNLYQGISEVPFKFKMLNTQQYLQVRREAFSNDGIDYTNPINMEQAYDLTTWDTTRYTNWQKFLWGNLGRAIDVQTSLSGGDKQTTFRIGGGYHRETSILTASGADQRASVQFNLSHKSLNQRLSSSFTSFYSYAETNTIPMPNIIALPPDAPAIYDGSGNLNWAGWAPVQNQYPFASLLRPYTSNTGMLNSQLSLQYAILKGLNLSTNLGYSTTHNSQTYVLPIASQDPTRNPTGSSRFGNNNNTNTIIEPQIEYKTILAKGKLDVLAGGSSQYTLQNGNILYATGYINDNLLRSAQSAQNTSGSNGYAQYKYAAVFARANYNWQDKYILNLTARRDGSSRFGPGKQYGNFWSAGAAWVFTEENWMKQNFSFLSFGKFRGSYGTTGSDPSLNYQYLSQWAATQVPYGGNTSYNSTLLPNPNLVWQSNHKLELAIDLGFLHDRLTFEFAWYRDRCGNQLVSYPLPEITGFTEITANSPAEIQNTGLESILKFKIIDNKHFSWSTYFNLGINRNKLLYYPNLSQSPYAYQYTIGKSLNIIRLLHYTGVDPMTGKYTFFDKNHDGTITTNYNNGDNDLYDIDLSVKYQGSFGTDLNFKGLQISAFFIFSKTTVPNSLYLGGFPGNIANQSVKIFNHWQKPGDQTEFARYTTGQDITDVNWAFYSDAAYSNGSYVRLRNLSISYDISKSAWLRNIGFNNATIYLRGENILTITKYDGDPEAPGLGSLPVPRIFTCGLRFNL